jgi:uncharacterized protein YbgA (DUF1722 family)/uncharacterized protein YbbK (DUF523 family)
MLASVFQFVPVCPELEMGLGVPRPPLRLAGDAGAPRLVFVESGADQAERFERWARPRLDALADTGLSGYILKSKSPSCGLERLPVYGDDGIVRRSGVGLFARALLERLPNLPAVEESRLRDATIRDNFVERVFCYRRWQEMLGGGFSRARLVAFHAAHKLVLMAHGPALPAELGRLVANPRALPPGVLRERYAASFMRALGMRATRAKHTNVLHHILGYFKRHLDARDKAELVALIDDYRLGRAPLVAPLTLLRHHARRLEIPYLAEQVYLHPHPKEAMLRSHA